MKTFLLTFFLLITNYKLLIAEIRYVSHNGSSTPPYTSWATAADSIQKAINICNDGDSVIVDNGVYKENLIVDNEIWLIGMSMDSTVIDGRGMGMYTVEFRAKGIIQNFMINGKGEGTNDTYCIYSLLHDILIEDCMLLNAYTGAVFIESTSVVEECIMIKVDKAFWSLCASDTCYTILKNSLAYINNSTTAVVDFFDGGNPSIVGNIILGNGNSNEGIGVAFTVKSNLIKNNLVSGFRDNIEGGGIIDTAIINNNISSYVPNSTFQWVGIENVNEKSKLRNNIIAYNNIGISGFNQPDMDYNMYWQNIENLRGISQIGQKSIIADPMFVRDTIPSSMEGDFHLQAFSPAIDAGDPAILDVDGSRSDIGMFGGPLGEAYMYLDLPPRPPKNIQSEVISDSNKIIIIWDYNTEVDFSNYLIYRDTTSGFNPDSNNLYYQADTSYFEDFYISNSNNLYYKITSVDNQENESEAGDEVEIILVKVGEPVTKILHQYILYQNYPNPFNPSTTIGYSLKESGLVKIKIYNITGELIKTIDERWKESGYNEVVISGEGLSSGIYLYRIEVIGKGKIPTFSDMKKMILLK